MVSDNTHYRAAISCEGMDAKSKEDIAVGFGDCTAWIGEMKHGTIVRNMYQPDFQTYFVYDGISGRNARGIKVCDTGERGVFIDFDARYPKYDILDDREHFPIVGYIDIPELIEKSVKNAVAEYAPRGLEEK